jgi:endoplasmic reticulum-Golgi intermediate compartment protein 3
VLLGKYSPQAKSFELESMIDIQNVLKRIDNHSAVSSECRVHTIHGAILSVLTVFIIGCLIHVEYRYNFSTNIIERVHVNATSPRGLEIEFDITLHNVACAILAVDSHDPAGQSQSLHLDQRHHVRKHRISKDGKLIGSSSKLELGSSLLDETQLLNALQNRSTEKEDTTVTLKDIQFRDPGCGSCYGAGEENECCDTCDDVKRAYEVKGWNLQDLSGISQCKEQVKASDEEGEGCNVYGKVALNSGGGNLHLVPNRNLDGESKITSIIDVFIRTFETFNVSHTIDFIRFGDEYPGHIHQLDQQVRHLQDSNGMYQYYFQIVPTTYKFLDGRTITTNQYSVTEHMRHLSPGSGRGLPGVFLFYELSPLHVVIEEYRRGWVTFFTSVAAIIGGVVTILGQLDQLLYGITIRHKSMNLIR